MSKSPLAAVNDDFGGKDKLVDKLVGLLPSSDEPKDDLRKRLLAVSNKKLLRLHRVATTVQEKFGSSREKLIAGAAAGRDKDKDYLTRIEGLPTPQLVDLATSAERRIKRAAAPKGADRAKRPAAPQKKAVAPKKTAVSASAKKTAAKKSVAKNKKK